MLGSRYVIIVDTHVWISLANDPPDGLIAAMSVTENAPLVTRDERIQAYWEVKTIW